MEAAPVAMCRLPRGAVAVACMHEVLAAYSGSSGSKLWSVPLPAAVTAMAPLEVCGQRMSKGLVLALANGEGGGRGRRICLPTCVFRCSVVWILPLSVNILCVHA